MKQAESKILAKLGKNIEINLPDENSIVVTVLRVRRLARFAILDALLKMHNNQDLEEYLNFKHLSEEKSIRDITSDLNKDVLEIINNDEGQINSVITSIRNEIIDLFQDSKEVTKERIDSAFFGSLRTSPSARFDFLNQKQVNSITHIHKNAITRLMDELGMDRRGFDDRHTERYKEKRIGTYNLKREQMIYNTRIGKVFINTEDISGFVYGPDKEKITIHPSEIIALIVLDQTEEFKSPEEFYKAYIKKCNDLIKQGINIHKPDKIENVLHLVSNLRHSYPNTGIEIPLHRFKLVIEENRLRKKVTQIQK